MVVRETGGPMDQLDAVTVDVALHYRGHRVDDLPRATPQRADLGLQVEVHADAVHLSALETGHVQRGLTQGLRRHATIEGRGTAGTGRALHDRGAMAEVR